MADRASLGGQDKLRTVLLPSFGVLPLSALSVWVTDRDCNHLEGDIEVAEPGTPRGRWCSAVYDHHHWILLIAGPCLVAASIAASVGLFLARRGRRQAYARWLGWGIGAAIACAIMLHVSELEPAYTI